MSIRAAVSVIDPIAQVSAVVPIADISSIVITYFAYLDTSGRVKFIYDTAAVIDALQKSTTNVRVETVQLSDDRDTTFGKTLAQELFVFDNLAIVLAVIRQFDDQATLSDTRVLGVEKAVAELISASGEPALSTQKPIPSSVSTADLRHWLLAKSLADGIFLADEVQLSTGMGLADSATGDDAGYLISQGYTENNTYFLEDFVGDSRIFT